jgi:hypothetical protein
MGCADDLKESSLPGDTLTRHMRWWVLCWIECLFPLGNGRTDSTVFRADCWRRADCPKRAALKQQRFLWNCCEKHTPPRRFVDSRLLCGRLRSWDKARKLCIYAYNSSDLRRAW